MKPLTYLIFDWGVRAFGIDHMYNHRIRALRVAEEAVELAQSFDVPKEKLHQLIDLVYDRPKGQPQQEIGGVLVTIATLCVAHSGRDPEDYLLDEVARVLAKPVEHFSKRNEDKINSGLTIA